MATEVTIIVSQSTTLLVSRFLVWQAEDNQSGAIFCFARPEEQIARLYRILHLDDQSQDKVQAPYQA